ncbi:MAG: CAP domain-containing protein [Polaromonas sp.]|uniref:CAP domain-containing protein n=1 Tax=Comamonadaceae TaxID=80864 RepID=UPI00272F8AA8|nr:MULTISPECIES: CAP domain-containing protein [Comamonadaceae]MDP2017305.1 CAP domain-containing protein [Hydrogenophaga sp.]MDP3248363.1 CAP domain-containing protein [Polaromonas sp.]MDP3811891.1 CAP domain-containing protein [Hydrogenophaga sp.]
MNSFAPPSFFHPVWLSPTGRVPVVLVLCVLLLACGGGGGDDAPALPEGLVGTTPTTVSGSSAATGGGAGPVVLDASTSCGLPDFRTSLLQQINVARSVARSCGSTAMAAAAPLAWNDRLFSAAARHSRDMATRNYFSHIGLDGRSPAQRVADEGYAWSWVGENIAAGQPGVSAVMGSWLASPGHCANIMRPEFQEVGVSCVQQAGSTYGRYWTMALGRPQ